MLLINIEFTIIYLWTGILIYHIHVYFKTVRDRSLQIATVSAKMKRDSLVNKLLMT